MKKTIEERPLQFLLLLLTTSVFIWSVIKPRDYFTWALEVAPVIIGAGVLIATHRRFELTKIVYILITLHAVILMIGGHYTYAEVPFFNWLRDILHLTRNHYDRLGHFVQGFVPAMIAREILIRKGVIQNSKWLFFIVTTICLSISAFYELIEWWVAVATGTAATAFLGTQGDVWDTQWDMFFALNGSLSAQLLLSRMHDRQLAHD